MAAEVTVDAELTVQEAARFAGVSDRTIRNWINGGELPAKSEPSGRKIRTAALLELLALKGYAPPDLAPPVEVAAAVAAAEREGASAPPAAPPPPENPSHNYDKSLAPLLEQLDKERQRTDRLHRENLELAGRVGFLQARLMDTEQKLLSAAVGAEEAAEEEVPRAPEPMAAAEPHKPWWKKVFGL